jgi:hypothetical protein
MQSNPNMRMARRLWKLLDRSGDNGCWLFVGYRNAHGYGVITIPNVSKGHSRRAWLTHRVAWMLKHGRIPDELSVLHRCHVRACCNPAHLYLGTQQDNMRDATLAGSMKRGAEKRAGTLTGERSPNAKLTDAAVTEIRQLYATGMSRVRYHELAETYGVSRSTISSVGAGKGWPHIPTPPRLWT